MEWVELLRDELDSDSIDFSTPATILQGLFQHALLPNISVDANGKLRFSDAVTVKVGGSKAICTLLSQPKVFLALPSLLQKVILDVLFIIFSRGLYEIVRFQYLDDLHAAVSESCSLNRLLLKLLSECLLAEEVSVAKRVLLLLGYSSSIGMSLHELKDFLLFLRVPSPLSMSLLQSFHTMLQVDMGASKARPPSIFNFSGPGSGIIMKGVTFPFPKEYQIAMWFRVESFEENPLHGVSQSTPERAFNMDSNNIQHLITWKNQSRRGLDVFLEKGILIVAVSLTSKTEPILLRLTSNPLKRGVWYHLSVRHSKPKMAFFSKDELEVCLDHEVVRNENIRFPNLANNTDIDLVVGHNFDGQMGPISFFNESLPSFAMHMVARIDAGRGGESGVGYDGVHNASDLMKQFTAPDRRQFTLAGKITACFHPSRCANGRCIDVHNGFHGQMRERTFPWSFINPRDVLPSLGGVLCLLPLFPRLLIENENVEKYSATPDLLWGVGLGTCIADVDDSADLLDQVYDRSLLRLWRQRKEEFYSMGPVTCLIQVIARAIVNSSAFQDQLLVNGGIEMIESSLQCVPQPLIADENEKCAIAIVQLKEAAVFSETLQLRVSKLLLSNTALWANSGSYNFLSSLLSVVLSSIKGQPAMSSTIVDIRNLLESLGLFDSAQEDTKVRSRINSISSAGSAAPPSPGKVVFVDEPQTDAVVQASPAVFSPVSQFSSQAVGDTEGNIGGLPLFSPRLHQALSLPGSAINTPTVRTLNSSTSSPASRLKTSTSIKNPNQNLIASLRKMKSFKLALSETLQDEVEEEMASPSNGDLVLTPARLDAIDERDESGGSNDEHDGDVQPSGDAPLAQVEPESEVAVAMYSALESKHLRDYLGSILAVLLVNNLDESDVPILVEYLVSCKDALVLVEIIDVLIFLVSNHGAIMTGYLVNAFGGAEEFVSYVIIFIVHQPNEELRCAGIRLLAHFVVYMDELSTAQLTLSSRKSKKSLAKSAMDGLQRLQSTGALALLCEVLSSHCPSSSVRTYRALLDLLLLNSGCLSSTVRNYHLDPMYVTGGSERKLSSVSPLLFDPDQMEDEGGGVVEPAFLPLFFELLPKFPPGTHDQMFSDLLSMIKQSPPVRGAFCACPSWHLCMFDLVLELLTRESTTSSSGKSSAPTSFRPLQGYEILEDIQQRAASTALPVSASPVMQRKRNKDGQPPLGQMQRKGSAGRLEVELLRRWKHNSSTVPTNNRHSSALKFSNTLSPDYAALSDADLNFDLCMRIYSSLLLHAMDKRLGWKDVDQSISPSFESEKGYLIAQSILSHLLNEITFSFQSRQNELQKLKRSSNVQDQQSADIRLKNLLSTVLSACQVSLIDQNCVMNVIPFSEVCKKRVHYFYELQAESQDLFDGTARGEGESDALSPSVRSDSHFHELSLAEQRSYLNRVEMRLRKFFLQHDTGIAVESESEMGEFVPVSECLDLSHEWYDLGSAAPTSRSSIFGDSPNVGLSGLVFTAEKPLDELLHPLERQHDAKTGKIILVLQSLRILDALFWPTSEGDLQEADLLTFSKEASLISSTTAAKSTDGKSKSVYLNIFSAIMRMSLFTLSTVSPGNSVSTGSLKRLRKAVVNTDRLAMDAATPVDDWIVATFTHVTLHLQRLVQLMEPIFEQLGVHNSDFRVSTFGPWSDADEDVGSIPPEQAEALQFAAQSHDSLKNLEDYFENTVGANLLRNIRHSFRLLIDLFQCHYAKLSTVIDDRSYQALWFLVDQVKQDLQIIVERDLQPSEHDTAGIVDAASSQNDSSRTMSSDGRSPSVNEQTLSINPPVKLSVRSLSSDVDGTSETSSRLGDALDAAEKSLGITTSTSPSKPPPRSTSSVSLEQPELLEWFDSHFDGHAILTTLKWMLLPFLRINILRSVQVVKSLDKLDNLEAKAVAKFSIETRMLKESLEEHRDVALKSVMEMAELKSLSREVADKLLDRGRQKRSQINAQNVLKAKNVAAKWHDCIQRFEDDWSPWAAQLDESAGCAREGGEGGMADSMRAVAQYQLSKHRDCKLRNMLLMKLPEPIDHRDAAHLESKLKDQIQFLANQGESSSSASSSNAVAAKPPIPLKFTPLAFAANQRGGATGVRSTSTASNTEGGSAGTANGGGNQQSVDIWADIEDGDDDGEAEDGVKHSVSLATFTAGDLINPLGFFTSQEKRPIWTSMFYWAADERVLLVMDANQIQLDQVIAGTVLLTNRCLYFHCKKRLGGLAQASKPFVDRKYHLERLIEAYGRRYLLQNSAVELFFADSPELFLAFRTSKELQRFFRILKNQQTPLLTTSLYLNPMKLYKHSKYTEMWRRRLISNFEYLMRLNVLAGRSYNDITQYPVFPWVIADYDSRFLDLKNPRSFRPLDQPIGAINKDRLREFLERYRTFDDDQVPKFMYGSHYSSAGVVLHYMVRQEPFTTLAINLQSGRFDCPDRIFFDIRRTWQGCNNSMSDVKEMIPELYCCPEILLNTNKLPLGELQEGGVVDNVILPPWAKDAFDFIRINREALESEYVSEHLHEWIDLIFGYKQKGPEAVKASNVFYYLTYENAINIEAIDDQLQREAAKAQVTHFGQTPSQLLTKEHPKRLPRAECVLPLCHSAESVSRIRIFTPAGSAKQVGRHHQYGAVIAMQCIGERLLVFHESMQLCYYRWTAFQDIDGTPFTVRNDRVKQLPSAVLSYAETLLKGNLSVANPGTARTSVTSSISAASDLNSAGGDVGGETASSAPVQSVESDGPSEHEHSEQVTVSSDRSANSNHSNNSNSNSNGSSATTTSQSAQSPQRPGSLFSRIGPQMPFTEVSVCGTRGTVTSVSVKSGFKSLEILKTTQSGFVDFHKCKYTSLPEVKDRLVGTSVDAEWTYSPELIRRGGLNFNKAYKDVETAMIQTFTGPADKGVYSPSVQETLYLMAAAAIKAAGAVEEVTLYMPNIHNLPFPLETYGLKNKDHTGYPTIFYPIDEPHGMIKATVKRAGRAKL